MNNNYWNYWSKEEPSVHVSSKLPKSPAIGYAAPDLKSVAVKISSDTEDFIPTYLPNENTANLLANLNIEKLCLPKGSSDIIDCGFNVEIPAGYRLCVSSSISNTFLNLIDSNRVKVNILNFGEELILIDKQKIGKIWIEPVYFFEWIMKG